MFPGGEGDALAGRHGLAFAEPVGDRSDAARRARVDDAILIISREMLVADQTIGPEVGDADLEHIGARAHSIGDIDTVRRLPELAQARTSVWKGKSVYVSVTLGGGRI